MEIILGKMAGFCPGVKNAIIKATKILEENNKNEKVFCLGDIVHNNQVIKNLNEKGLEIIDDIKNVNYGSKVIFRAHGVSKEIYNIADERNIKTIDLTCPKVFNLHKMACELSNNGCAIILIASKEHPETIGTFSFCGKEKFIVEDEEDVEKVAKELLEKNIDKVSIISQTTFSMEKFDKIIEKIKNILEDKCEIDVNKTICNATKLRQEETEEMSKVVDCMIIIGGKKSSNTNKLYEISTRNCKNVFFIETKDELNMEKIKGFEKIGIMAGASTPQESINEVLMHLKSINQ